MTPEQIDHDTAELHHPGYLVGNLDNLKYDLWFEYTSMEETPNPQEFSKWAIQHRGCYALYLTQETDVPYIEWLNKRVEEDYE